MQEQKTLWNESSRRYEAALRSKASVHQQEMQKLKEMAKSELQAAAQGADEKTQHMESNYSTKMEETDKLWQGRISKLAEDHAAALKMQEEQAQLESRR